MIDFLKSTIVWIAAIQSLESITALQCFGGIVRFKVFHNQAELSEATDRVAVPPQALILTITSSLPNATSATMVGFWGNFYL